MSAEISPDLEATADDLASLGRALIAASEHARCMQATRRCATRVERARQLLFAERRRAKCFPGLGNIFGEPGWLILLDLYVACARGISVSVTSACFASQCAPTTALRAIDLLEHRDMLRRTPDTDDGRRIFLTLTDRGAAAMDLYLAET